MPRPPVKRSKLNKPSQAAKGVANYPLSSSPAARRRQLEEQLAHKDVGRVPNDSDDSDELVIKSRNPRNRRGVPRQEIYGSGGVAQGDKTAAHKSPSTKRQRMSPKTLFRAEVPLSGDRKDTPLKYRGLGPINRLSTTQSPSPSVLKSVNPLGVRNQETPSADASILGPLKLRKRQPSILRLIDGPDSSTLDLDLEDFLPDDESTPLNVSRKRKLSLSPKTPLPAQSQPQAGAVEVGTGNSTNTEPDLPPAPSSAISERRTPHPEPDDEIMAPPQSSSSNPSPVKATTTFTIKDKTNARKAKETKSISTTALQALMPARRQQRARRDRAAKAASEFDIPEDSSDPQGDTFRKRTGDSSAEESYIASPRTTGRGKRNHPQPTKHQKKKNPPTRNPDAKHPQAEKERSRADGGPRNKNTSTHSSPPTVRATPAVTKPSSSSQQPQQRTETPVKLYSRRADGAGAGTEDADAGEHDKENRPSPSSAGSSKRARRPGRAKSAKTLSGPADIDDADFAIQVDRAASATTGRDSDDSEGGFRGEQARLVQKFKEVDEWEMEFEDVTVDGSGMWSDPLAR